MQQLTGRDVWVEFVKEGLTFTGEDSPMANLRLNVMGAFAELRRRTDARESKADLALEFGISRATLYEYLRAGE